MCAKLVSWLFRNEVVQRMTKEKKRTIKRQKASKTGGQGNEKGDYQTAKKKATDCLIRDIVSQDPNIGKDSATTSYPSPFSIPVNEIESIEIYQCARLKSWEDSSQCYDRG
jgi:hypothetical protein